MHHFLSKQCVRMMEFTEQDMAVFHETNQPNKFLLLLEYM